jgi:hypothetical protein
VMCALTDEGARLLDAVLPEGVPVGR